MALIKLLKRIRVYDKNPTLGGKIIYDSGQSECCSFIINFMKHIESAMEGADKTATGTGGSSRTITEPGSISINRYWFRATQANDNDDMGIVIGTGTTTEVNTDTKLETLITDGATSGKMEYETGSIVTTAVVSTNVDYVQRRTFTNSSGASITVNEIGVYCQTYMAATARYYGLVREVITATAVADGQTLEIELTLRTTV